MIEKPMSEQQIAASRANGSRSQGPVTPEGHDRCRSSALKHGLYSQSFEQSIVALGESPEEFKQFHDGLATYWQPVDALRKSLVMRLARALWKLERSDRAESDSTARQIQALQADSSANAQAVEAEFAPRLRRLKFLLESTRQGDLADRESLLPAFNTYYGRQRTPRSKRIYELLFDPSPVPSPEEPAVGEAESAAGEAESAESPAGSAEQTAPADSAATARAVARALDAELERLLEDELREAVQTYERLKQQAQPSPAEWNARLVPESAFLLRYQDSQSRQVERLIRLLSQFKVQDELKACEAPSNPEE